MSFCPNCGNPLGENVRFCANCGTAVAEPEAPVAPAAPVYVEPAPTYYGYEAPVVSTKAKVLGFIGMGLSIGGLVFAVAGLVCTFAFMSVEEGMGLFWALYFSFFSFPLSIVGGVLCSRSTEMGNHSTACSVGSKMRIAGIIVSAVMLFFGLVSLGM